MSDLLTASPDRSSRNSSCSSASLLIYIYIYLLKSRVFVSEYAADMFIVIAYRKWCKTGLEINVVKTKEMITYLNLCGEMCTTFYLLSRLNSFRVTQPAVGQFDGAHDKSMLTSHEPSICDYLNYRPRKKLG